MTVFDINIDRLRELDAEFGIGLRTRYSSAYELEAAVKRADLGDRSRTSVSAAPEANTLVSNSVVAHMKPGACLVDIAINQDGLLRRYAADHPR